MSLSHIVRASDVAPSRCQRGPARDVIEMDSSERCTMHAASSDERVSSTFPPLLQVATQHSRDSLSCVAVSTQNERRCRVG